MFEVGNYFSKINTNSIFEQNWLSEHRSCDILHRLHEQIFLDKNYSQISSIDVALLKQKLYIPSVITHSNHHLRFVLSSKRQIYGGDFAKFCGLLRISEL